MNNLILSQLKQFNEDQCVLIKIKGAMDSLYMHFLHIFLLQLFHRDVKNQYEK